MLTAYFSTEMVKGHLMTYFQRCQQALVGAMGMDQELSLLCTLCLEVSTPLMGSKDMKYDNIFARESKPSTAYACMHSEFGFWLNALWG